MTDKSTGRRSFIKLTGLAAGLGLSTPALAGFLKEDEIKSLNPVQLEFMKRYGEWMDEYIDVIRLQKLNPDNPEVRKKVVSVAEKAEIFQPELTGFMKDNTFAIIFKHALGRVTKEI